MTGDSNCLPTTAAYTFNGNQIAGQAIYESVHPPLSQLSGGGRKKRRVSRTKRKSSKRSAKRTARRSARRTARRSARRTARRAARRAGSRTRRSKKSNELVGRRAVYRELEKSQVGGLAPPAMSVTPTDNLK